MVKCVVRVVLLVLVATLAVGLAGGSAVSSAGPAGSPTKLVDVAGKAADEQVRTVPIIVPRYDSGLVPADTPSGYQERCATQAFIRFPEIHGYQADHIVYTWNLVDPGPRYIQVSPPYDDDNHSGADAGGDFLLPAGMHQRLLTGFYSTTNGPPGVFDDCSAKQAEIKAQYGPTATVTYVPSRECAAAKQAVTSAKKALKAAKKTLKHASTADAKRKAKKKVKKAKKKLHAATDHVTALC
jgi:uncharacterized protein YqgV (UPF0045/DUF77 family)